MVKESPRESLFKDRYFVSGIGSGIAKRFKDPALAISYDDILKGKRKEKAGKRNPKSDGRNDVIKNLLKDSSSGQ